MTRIIVDAFGGDNAPLEVLKGIAMAITELNVIVLVCGNEPELRELCAKDGISTIGMEFYHANSVIPVDVAPTELLRKYGDSSMAVAMKLLADGIGDAFVSAGSTGAIVVGATMIVKRIRGIKRPALGAVIPNSTGCYMLMDAGANSECRPEMLQQFGIMGSIYMQKLLGVKIPRVGLVNIGTEATKGMELQVQAHKLLSESPINFMGNIEARDIPLGGCDVAVADGFTGNIVLKLTEGMAKMMAGEVKKMLLTNAKTKIAAAMLKDSLVEFKSKLDYSEHGGAPLMGVTKPVIKAHGSSNAKAFKNAIKQAKIFHENKVISLIEESLLQISDK